MPNPSIARVNQNIQNTNNLLEQQKKTNNQHASTPRAAMVIGCSQFGPDMWVTIKDISTGATYVNAMLRNGTVKPNDSVQYVIQDDGKILVFGGSSSTTANTPIVIAGNWFFVAGS
jgi:lysine/ornithine N-monooxygenase